MAELFKHEGALLRAPSLPVSHPRLIETVVESQPFGVRQVDLVAMLGVGTDKVECFVPFLVFDVENDQRLGVS